MVTLREATAETTCYGWTNWDTWNAYNWLSSDELAYQDCRFRFSCTIEAYWREYFEGTDDIDSDKVNWEEIAQAFDE